MEPQNNSDTATPLSITPPEPITPIEALATTKISSPSDPIVTSVELKSPLTPPAESTIPPTEPQLPPISPQVPPIMFNSPTEPPLPPTVSETTPPKKGGKLVLIGIILLIFFLVGYGFVTFSGLMSK